ncbi:MAG: NAD(P)/FAD-dependent oxidoreductase [Demequinaceae bacterium]|nr:NAD(P)/FAD-dependent oxidoreductase [Demequinaceae bacterium]
MKRLVILGAGTAGTIAANKMRRKLKKDEWDITIVEQAPLHDYQPGYLFMAFGRQRIRQIRRPVPRLLPRGVTLISGSVESLNRDEKTVVLADQTVVPYDYLVIATGVSPRPDQTPGMGGGQWGKSIHSFYTFDDALALKEKLATWEGGRLVMHVTEMPIKCPVAPLEFSLLADSFFRRRGMRDKVSITFVTPLPGAFTRPIAAATLGDLLGSRDIAVEPDFMIERIDEDTHALVSYDEREVPFDLLVTVPVNMGADFVGLSGLGDDLNLVEVDKGTMLSTKDDSIFALGDATNIPTSKAGAVAHFQMDLFVDIFLRHLAGKEAEEEYDGHAICFVESGGGKGLLLDFNYETEPLPGSFPFPLIGPLRLLKESRINHWSKLAFRYVYWMLLLPGRYIPMSAHLSLWGKKRPKTA